MRNRVFKSVSIACALLSLVIIGCDAVDERPASNSTSAPPTEEPSADTTTTSTGTSIPPTSGSVLDSPTPPPNLGLDPEHWSQHKPEGRVYLLNNALKIRGAAVFKPLGLNDARPVYNLENFDQMIEFYAASQIAAREREPFNTAAFDELVKHKATLTRLEVIQMDLPDDFGQRLPELENLEILILNSSTRTASVLESIGKLQHLKECTLIDMILDDQTFANIDFPPGLTYLDIRTNEAITDISVPKILGLTMLTDFSIAGTGISADGKMQLQSGLPNYKPGGKIR